MLAMEGEVRYAIQVGVIEKDGLLWEVEGER